jgi:hypothetical protein
MHFASFAFLALSTSLAAALASAVNIHTSGWGPWTPAELTVGYAMINICLLMLSQ